MIETSVLHQTIQIVSYRKNQMSLLSMFLLYGLFVILIMFLVESLNHRQTRLMTETDVTEGI